MKIKTFPLQFTEDKLQEIKEIAASEKKSIKDFILESIEKEIDRVKEGK